MNINDIEKSVCLCLDKREESWLELEADLDKVGIKMDRFIVGDGKTLDCEYNLIDTNEIPAFMDKSYLGASTNYATWYERPNAYNAFKSHIKIIEQAREEGCKNILMLEDDSILTNDFAEIFEELPSKGWDALYLGWFGSNNTELYKHGENTAARRVGGFHGVIVNHTMFDLICEAPPVAPLDNIVGTRLSNHFTYYVCTPKIILQKAGLYSEVEGQINWSGGVEQQIMEAYDCLRLQDKHRQIVQGRIE